MVRKGEPAPFEGVLLTRQDLATLITKADQKVGNLEAQLANLKHEHKLITDVAEAKCAAMVRAEKSNADACLSARTKESAIYEQALKKANDTPFWKSPTLMTILGLGAGAAVCAIAR